MNSDIASIAVSLAINLILIGAILTIGIAIAFRKTRHFSPRIRYMVGVAAFCIAAFYPIIATFNTTERPPEITGAAAADAFILKIEEPPSAFEVSTTTTTAQIEKPVTQTDQSKFNLGWVIDAATKSGAGTIFLFLWLSVAVLLIARDLVGHLRLTQARRQWKSALPEMRHQLMIDASVPLLISRQMDPSTVGWLRPAVVIPSNLFDTLDPDSARRIIRHELSHARWRDPLVYALMRLIRAALWISPPLWLLESIARIEREAAADREAIGLDQSLVETNMVAVEYATSLVQIAYQRKDKRKGRSFDLMAAHFGQPKGLETRVKRLFILPPSAPVKKRLCLTLAVAALFASVSSIAFLPLVTPPLNTAKSAPAENQLVDSFQDESVKESTTALDKPANQTNLPVGALNQIQHQSGLIFEEEIKMREEPMLTPTKTIEQKDFELKYQATTVGDKVVKPTNEKYGDPVSKFDLSSDGMGSGGGQGSGRGTGQGSGTGSGGGNGIGDGTGNGRGTGESEEMENKMDNDLKNRQFRLANDGWNRPDGWDRPVKPATPASPWMIADKANFNEKRVSHEKQVEFNVKQAVIAKTRAEVNEKRAEINNRFQRIEDKTITSSFEAGKMITPPKGTGLKIK